MSWMWMHMGRREDKEAYRRYLVYRQTCTVADVPPGDDSTESRYLLIIWPELVHKYGVRTMYMYSVHTQSTYSSESFQCLPSRGSEYRASQRLTLASGTLFSPAPAWMQVAEKWTPHCMYTYRTYISPYIHVPPPIAPAETRTPHILRILHIQYTTEIQSKGVVDRTARSARSGLISTPNTAANGINNPLRSGEYSYILTYIHM